MAWNGRRRRPRVDGVEGSAEVTKGRRKKRSQLSQLGKAVGRAVGRGTGTLEGTAVDGNGEGTCEGADVGTAVVGTGVGMYDGLEEGNDEGAAVGTAVGDFDKVGLNVGKPPRSPFVEVSCNDWGPLETAELPRTSSRRQWASLSSPVTSTS